VQPVQQIGVAGLGAAAHLLPEVLALIAAEAGAVSEAAWAMNRCRDASRAWEFPPFRRRLNEFVSTHPEHDLAALYSAIDGNNPVSPRN
jgi:hypothetical protein